jgi:hypothetical protein
MKEQQRAEAVVETVPEDPSRPDGATDMTGASPNAAKPERYTPRPGYR